MVSKLIKCLLIISFNSNLSFGQGNPGFLGKKLAVGYNTQYCLFKTMELYTLSQEDYDHDDTYQKPDLSKRQLLTNNDFYLEYATKKFQSISIHYSNQKIPVSYTYYKMKYTSEHLDDIYDYNGITYKLRIYKNGGYANYSWMSYGLKYSFFKELETISSPVGFSYYIRTDVNRVKLIENNFVYKVIETNPSWLSSTEVDKIENAIKDKYTPDVSNNLSFGFGAETKLPITATLFFRLSAECNFSTAFFKINSYNNFDMYDNKQFTVDQDLDYIGLGVNRHRNLVLIGMGFGAIL
ncbi:MAG: hypothetical protein ACKVQB_11280 [Bacteroidia bacterium]